MHYYRLRVLLLFFFLFSFFCFLLLGWLGALLFYRSKSKYATGLQAQKTRI